MVKKTNWKKVGRRSKEVGKTTEREVVRKAKAYGLPTRRTWQKAVDEDPGARVCDVVIAGEPFQVKYRGKGFQFLYGALEGVRGLFLRASGERMLAVVDADHYLSLVRTVQLAQQKANKKANADVDRTLRAGGFGPKRPYRKGAKKARRS